MPVMSGSTTTINPIGVSNVGGDEHGIGQYEITITIDETNPDRSTYELINIDILIVDLLGQEVETKTQNFPLGIGSAPVNVEGVIVTSIFIPTTANNYIAQNNRIKARA
jgi:hypothetical protein